MPNGRSGGRALSSPKHACVGHRHTCRPCHSQASDTFFAGGLFLYFLSAFCLLGLYWMFEIINKNTKKRCSGLKKDPCPRKQPLSYPSVPPPSSAPLSGLKMSPQRRDGCLRGAPGIALGIALVSWWWHHSRRRGDCSHVLTACVQATSLKGVQGVLWRLL